MRGSMTWLALAGGFILMFAGGCGPKVEFLQTSCAKVPNSPSPNAMEFNSTVQVKNLEGQQVVFGVSLLNAAARPVRSRDDKFRDSKGYVGATRTFLVANSNFTLENATVSIPWDQLELNSENPPAMAEFSISLADGTPMANERVRLPTASPRRTAPGRRVPDDRTTAMADRLKQPETRRPPARLKPEERVESRDPRRSPAARRQAPNRNERPPRAAEAESRAKEVAEDQDVPRPPDFTPPEKPPRPQSSRAAPSRTPATRPKPSRQSPERDSMVPPATPAESADRRRPTSQPARVDAAKEPSSQPARIDPLGARRYVVRRGDTLPGIAGRMLGKASRWREILELNRDQLDSSYNLKEGMELWIPLPDPEGRRP